MRRLISSKIKIHSGSAVGQNKCPACAFADSRAKHLFYFCGAGAVYHFPSVVLGSVAVLQ